MTCTVRQRERVREAAAEVRACDGVVAATVLAPTEGTEPTWSISLVTAGRLQPAALERIAANDLCLGPFTPQGDGFEAPLTP